MLNLFFYLSTFAQKQASIWYFGHHAGLDFSTSPPTVLEDGNKMATFEGCTTICDSSGNLLFYSDGISIWDSSHNLMKDNLGNPVNNLKGDPSAVQSGLVVPNPGNDKIYYLFSLPPGGIDIAYYSVIDFTSGTGVVTQKNVGLSGYSVGTNTSEKITVTLHNNGIDFWVLTHQSGSNRFVLHKVTASGISTTPILQDVGSRLGSFGDLGVMKFSPDGKRLAMATYFENKLDIYDFNDDTGRLTLKETIALGACFGLEFSPNSNLLYVTYGRGIGGGNMVQYDLTTAGLIKSTEIDIYAPVGSPLSCMQIGIDNKIYVSVNTSEYMGVIQNPNNRGLACGYDHTAINLNPSGATDTYAEDIPSGWGVSFSRAKHHAHLGLPNFIQAFFAINISTKGLCEGDATKFSVSTKSYTNYNWDFGDGNTSTDASPSHTYALAGTYNVSVFLSGGATARTITKKITVSVTPLVSRLVDRNICVEDGVQALNIATPLGGIYKVNGILATQFNPKTLGVGSHRVSYEYKNSAGCSDIKTVTYTVNVNPVISNMVNENRLDVEIKNGYKPFEIKLANRKYKLDQRVFSLHDLPKDKYTLSVKDKFGCVSSKEVEIKNVLIYNYFSPNGDGINDTWKLPDLVKFYPESRVTIFDRNGKIITKYKLKDKVWDGKLDGKDLPSGSYYYQIVLPNGQIYKGVVNILK